MISGMFEFRGSCSLGLHSLILEGGEQVFEDPPHNIKERGAGCPRTGLLMFLLVRGLKIIDINCRTNHVCMSQIYNATNLHQITKTCAVARSARLLPAHKPCSPTTLNSARFLLVAADSQSTRHNDDAATRRRRRQRRLRRAPWCGSVLGRGCVYR